MYRFVNDYQDISGVYMYFDEIRIGCGIPYGDEEYSTTISFSIRSYQLDLQYSDGYSFYFAYQLAEVTNGELAWSESPAAALLTSHDGVEMNN